MSRNKPRDLRTALDPSTPPAALAELARQQHDAEVLRAIMKNPNTPPATLYEWGPRFPQDLLLNPVLPLLLMESSSFFYEMRPEAQLLFLQWESVPEDLISFAAAHRRPSFRVRAAKNPATPPKILLSLLDDRDRQVRRAAAKNPALAEAPRDLLALILLESPSSLREVFRQNPAAPHDLLDELPRLRKIELQRTVAQDPKTPPCFLERLAENPDKAVRQALAQNPALPLALLKKLGVE